MQEQEAKDQLLEWHVSVPHCTIFQQPATTTKGSCQTSPQSQQLSTWTFKLEPTFHDQYFIRVWRSPVKTSAQQVDTIDNLMSSSCEYGLAYMPTEAEVDQADKTRGKSCDIFCTKCHPEQSVTAHKFSHYKCFWSNSFAIGIHSCTKEMVGKTSSPRECMLNSQ